MSGTTSPIRSYARQARPRDAEAYDRFERAVELPMLVLALCFIPLLAAEALGWGSRAAIEAMYLLLSAAFAVEYLIKLYLAPNRWRMVATHIPDLLLIALPFLRPLRAARLLRFLRVGAAAGRAGVAVRRISTRRGFRGFLLVVLLVSSVSGVLMWMFERGANELVASPVDGLWWALVTATTVGYGDVYPVTSEGRAIAVVLMFVGIALLSVVTANIAAFFLEEEDKGQQEVHERLERIERALQELIGNPSR